MKFSDIQTNIKQWVECANKKGIPLPSLRDPKTQEASVSLTMMFISFNIVLVGLIGKMAGYLGGVDVQQAIYWFMVCAGLYFSRRIGKDGNKVTLDQTNEEKETKE